jgi:hypothetical protein
MYHVVLSRRWQPLWTARGCSKNHRGSTSEPMHLPTMSQVTAASFKSLMVGFAIGALSGCARLPGLMTIVTPLLLVQKLGMSIWRVLFPPRDTCSPQKDVVRA